MATIKVYHHGITGGVAPEKNDHERSLRSDCSGWSASSTRSNTRFLYSVDESGLDGFGFALSLTVRHCPATHEDWRQVRSSFLKCLHRMGLIRYHWLTEWQQRGCPHLHAAVWFNPLPDVPLEQQQKQIMFNVKCAWVRLTSILYGSLLRSQHISPIRDSVGWFRYLSKHASRGLGHYQRNSASIPEGWHKTGRMWGNGGDWPLKEPVLLDLSPAAYHAYRRIIRNARIADARASDSLARLKSARQMLKCSDRNQSAVRGVSEWVEFDTSMRIMTHLAARGLEITV